MPHSGTDCGRVRREGGGSGGSPGREERPQVLVSQLHFLSIQRAGKKDAKKRSIPLEEIEKVSVGTDLASESGLPLDEFCVCFMLKEGQAIAFRIEDIEERDTFALILSMFVDQRTQEVERKKLKEAQKKK
mmetsp:Transcript_3836/g.7335  ORF Transcript_3836/g.7335 Transcript_3836/m.7335 type:complete len:131 (-) Transcript_3836:191-583(-)